jgi:hypothetical protein
MGAGIAASPHLHRAKDPPNLETRSQGNPLPNSGSPAQASLPINQLPPKRSLATSTPVRRPKVRFCFAPPGLTEVKADRCSAALLGMTLSCVPLCLRRPESRLQPRRAIERSSLPAPRPGWPRFQLPKELRHCPPRRWTLSPLPHLAAVAGPPMRPGPPSRSQLDLAPRFRVAASEKSGCKAVDNGDIGNNNWNHF